ncbi:uncharacterized protein [Primulina eburnea]|uniref:uncharacterized protein n=1 Tax=Primulina eburnea TaxID=1245227 RepID=UPI003C6C75FF
MQSILHQIFRKDVLNIISNQVRAKIRKEIGDAKFCILVDEARYAFNKEQMAIVLRFVDTEGFLREQFFAIVHVTDTTVATLKKEISDALGRYDLHIHNMRGQGYDGASNMCAAEKKVSIWLLFSKLNSICNLINASPKRHGELHYAQRIEVEHMLATGERDTDRGCNQIRNLLRTGKTRWSSNFDSFCSMIDMYNSVITVLENMLNDGASNSIRDNVDNKSAFSSIAREISGYFSVMDYVSMTKNLLRTFREEGFDLLLRHVKEVCVKYDIEIPHMEARYKYGTGRS